MKLFYFSLNCNSPFIFALFFLFTILTQTTFAQDEGDQLNEINSIARNFYESNLNGNILNDNYEPDAVIDTSFEGEYAGDNFGYSVAFAGDVNGDSYDDIIIGAYFYDVSIQNEGKVYIYFGGPTMDYSPDITILGENQDDHFGVCVSSAGDLNNDGYDDVIVGANGFDYGGFTQNGKAYIFFGGDPMNAYPDVVIYGEGGNDQLGSSVSCAGDVNGDGVDDLIIGANGYSSFYGRAYIYFGSTTINGTPTADHIWTGESSYDYFGISVSSAGDVNDDGYDDIIIGANQDDDVATNAGAAYIYFGGETLGNTYDLKLTGEGGSNYFGYSVSGAGDVNGDGYSDVVVGAYYYNNTTPPQQGRAYVYFGGSSMDANADIILDGENNNDQFGFSVTGGGDVNEDGFSDFIIGARFWTNTTSHNKGRVYVYFGGTVTDDIPDIVLDRESEGGLYFGSSVATAGDVNGDGNDDILIGAPLALTQRGKAFLYKISDSLYVDINQANDDGDGLTWITAKKYLQSALAIADSGDAIFVAQGTYYADEGVGQTDNDRTSTFQMLEYVDIYGGYLAGTTSRDPSTYTTILSGDLDQSSTKNENDSYHVVTGASDVLLDGFTVTGGYAAGPASIDYYGAGMFNSNVSPTISNCIFNSNNAVLSGGGIYNDNASPIITACTFSENTGGAIRNVGTSAPTISSSNFLSNTSGGHGGAIYHSGYTFNVTDCLFDNNYSTDDGGAIHYNGNDVFNRCTFSNNSGRDGGALMGGGNSSFTNCVFLNNTARSQWGGGINAYYGLPVISHCTFLGNTAGSDGDGFIRAPGASTITITNSIFWGSNTQIAGDNIDVTYCDVQQESGTFPGTGNINSDPCCVSSTDLHLADDSPCIGAGTEIGVADDRDNNIRPNPAGSVPDMGAYENPLDEPLPVELSSFTATINNSTVNLNWKTEAEVSNYGFEIERWASTVWINIGFVEGNGNSNSPKEYSFNDVNPIGGCMFRYRLKQIDTDGTFEYSEEVEVELIPKQYELSQNYPNPFNPSTKIKYSVPQTSQVRIKVFDVLGNEIETLVNEEKPVGTYELTWYAENLPSGIYFYQLQAGSFIETKKMLLLK